MNIRFTHIFGGVVAATLFAALPFAAFADAPSMPGHGHGRGHAYGLIGKEVVANEDTTSTESEFHNFLGSFHGLSKYFAPQHAVFNDDRDDATTTLPTTNLTITNVTVNEISSTTARISWFSNLSGNTEVWLGTTTPVNSSGTPMLDIGNNTFYHTATLTGLTASTTYYLVVGTKASVNGSMATSSGITFTTSPTPVLAPVIHSIFGPTSVVAGQSNTWTINVSDANAGNLTYLVTWGDTTGTTTLVSVSTPPAAQTVTFSHIYANPGTYTTTFLIRDAAGLTASSSINIIATSTATTTSS